MILYNDRIITNSVGKWFQRPLHMVTTHGNHGSVNANPNAGEFGTNVTLSNTPDTGYRFTSYSIAGDGASLSGNTLIIGYSDVSVTGNFGINTYSITYSSVDNGSFSGPSSATYGSTVTITANPSSGYKLNYITVNGVRITGNTFTMPDGPITISGSFVVDYNPYNLPANTIRVKFKAGYTPTMGDSQTRVSTTPNIWDIYKAGTSLDYLFKDCNDLLEVLGANTTNIVTMDSVFSQCKSMTSVALFDTSNVTNMRTMFLECNDLTAVPLFDTSNVTDMTQTFDSCYALTTVPLFDTHNVRSMYGTFGMCTDLREVPLFDTSNVTSMATMFSYSGIRTLPLFDTHNVTSMRSFCYGCERLTSIPLFNTAKVTKFDEAFRDCVKVESGAYDLYYQLSHQTTPPTEHTRSFKNCGSDTTTGAADLARIPNGWK